MVRVRVRVASIRLVAYVHPINGGKPALRRALRAMLPPNSLSLPLRARCADACVRPPCICCADAAEFITRLQGAILKY